MSDAIKIPLDATRVVEPPIVDSLHRDRLRFTWTITFIPQDKVSLQEKETIEIPFDSAEGRQIQGKLLKIEKMLGLSIEHAYHSGGDNFTFHSADSHVVELCEPALPAGTAISVYDELQLIAMNAEHAFLIQRYRNAV